MSYMGDNEKMPMASMPMSRPVDSQDYKENVEIKSAKRILMTVLGIQLIFAVIYFIAQLIITIRHFNIPISTRDHKMSAVYIGSVISAGLTMIYIIIFLIAASRYARIPILILSWLGLLELIFIAIMVAISVIVVIIAAIGAHSVGAGFVASLFIICVIVVASILTILIVIYGFKLSKLLKMNEAYQLV